MTTSLAVSLNDFAEQAAQRFAQAKLQVSMAAFELQEILAEADKDPRYFDKRHHYSAVVAYALRDPGPTSFAFGARVAEKSQYRAAVIASFNALCTWNIAQSFEVLERFMRQCVGLIGYHDSSSLSPKIGILIPSGATMEQALAGILASHSLDMATMRGELYRALPRLERDEIQLPDQPDGRKPPNRVRRLAGIIEQLRHVIVHIGGKGQLASLYARTQQRLGIAASGTAWISLKDIIDSYLDIDGETYQVTFCKIRRLVAPYLNLADDFNHAQSCLTTQVVTIHENMHDLVGGKPFWHPVRQDPPSVP